MTSKGAEDSHKERLVTLLSQAICRFNLDAASGDWGYAADWLEDQGGCPVLAQAMRSGLYEPEPIGYGSGSGSGSGYGDGDGYGYGSGDGDGYGYGDGDGSGSGDGYGDGDGDGYG